MLSGLLRSNNSEKYLKKFIIDKYNVDVYCQAWYNNNSDRHQTQQKILERYSPKAILMQPNLTHRKSFKDEVYPELGKIHNMNVNRHYDSYFSQFLSIKNVSNMFDWSQYDFIIRARYDRTIIVNFPDLNFLDKSKFYAAGHYNVFKDAPIFFRDFIFIMPNTFKFYCDAFDYIRDEQFCNRMYQWHRELPMKVNWFKPQISFFYPELVFAYMFQEFGKQDYLNKLPPEQFLLEYYA